MSIDQLQALGSDSTESHVNKVKTTFNTRNQYFYSIQSRMPSLDRFPEWIERDLIVLDQEFATAKGKNYLSKQERIALNDLKHYCELVVRQADTGGNIVILDAKLYCQLNTEMLADAVIWGLADQKNIFYVR